MQIDKHVPIPEPRAVSGSVFPFNEMEVGDSFAIPASEIKLLKAARNAACNYKRAHQGWSYTAKTDGDSLRLWRTA